MIPDEMPKKKSPSPFSGFLVSPYPPAGKIRPICHAIPAKPVILHPRIHDLKSRFSDNILGFDERRQGVIFDLSTSFTDEVDMLVEIPLVTVVHPVKLEGFDEAVLEKFTHCRVHRRQAEAFGLLPRLLKNQMSAGMKKSVIDQCLDNRPPLGGDLEPLFSELPDKPFFGDRFHSRNHSRLERIYNPDPHPSRSFLGSCQLFLGEGLILMTKGS